MENQHRKITGYRELNQDEIDLMNEIKAMPVMHHHWLGIGWLGQTTDVFGLLR